MSFIQSLDSTRSKSRIVDTKCVVRNFGTHERESGSYRIGNPSDFPDPMRRPPVRNTIERTKVAPLCKLGMSHRT